jgi:hypothetical protein
LKFLGFRCAAAAALQRAAAAVSGNLRCPGRGLWFAAPLSAADSVSMGGRAVRGSKQSLAQQKMSERIVRPRTLAIWGLGASEA